MSGIRYDIENQLSVNQAFTGAATVSTHSYKKGSAAQDLSIGRRMALLVLPTVDAGAGSTVQIEAIEATDGALTTSISVLASVSIPAANFIKGQEIEVPIPQGVMSKQYVGARVTITGGTTTASMDIYLMPQDDIASKFKAFPKINHAQV
jgi:hypothetical protein